VRPTRTGFNTGPEQQGNTRAPKLVATEEGRREARRTCYAGKVDEALALYQSVIDLKGRVATKQ
jgi:hypothetical protein